MEELLNKGAFELSRMIKRKEVSPVEVINTHIRRIESVNDKINAVVTFRFEEALLEARKAEEKIFKGDTTGLLCGVPLTVKESISIQGYPLTAGSIFRKSKLAEEDSKVVQYLKQEGAIILGQTNTPECNFWMESYNKIYGRTKNPYDTDRTPGGSSGGEGAIVGAGGVPFGVGSDIAGSIRMPAAFCGVFGHRPTSHLISIKGHAFCERVDQQNLDQSEIKNNLVIGPLCRKSEDLFPLIKIMSGASDKEFQADEVQLNFLKTDWSDYTFYLCPSPDIHFASYPDKEISDIVEVAGKTFSNHGAKLEYLDHKIFYDAFEIWQSELTDANPHSLNEEFGNGKSLSLVKELGYRLIGKSHITLPGLLMCLGEKVFHRSEKEVKNIIQKGVDLSLRLESLLGKNALILMPVFPRVAPKNKTPLMRPLDWNYTTLFSALDFPASSVPMGLNAQNIPLSVQIIGNRNEDYPIILAAKLLDKIHGGWQMPKVR
ncbi:MAG: amidase [Sporocytophaga sp.]|nr:amidase [Sporocytophaga sp.]